MFSFDEKENGYIRGKVREVCYDFRYNLVNAASALELLKRCKEKNESLTEEKEIELLEKLDLSLKGMWDLQERLQNEFVEKL